MIAQDLQGGNSASQSFLAGIETNMGGLTVGGQGSVAGAVDTHGAADRHHRLGFTNDHTAGGGAGGLVHAVDDGVSVDLADVAAEEGNAPGIVNDIRHIVFLGQLAQTNLQFRGAVGSFVTITIAGGVISQAGITNQQFTMAF